MTKIELKDRAHKIIENKWLVFAAFWVGLIYITVYNFLKFPNVKITASMIGLEYPVAFKFWGFLSLIALSLNVNYMYKKFGYRLKMGYIAMLVGSIAIMICVHIPSTEIFGLQLVAHWSGALIFAVAFAFSIIWFLIIAGKKHKKWWITLGLFGVTLLLMIILLVSLGKSGIIESIPTWAAYVILFCANFTNIFKDCIPAISTNTALETQDELQAEAAADFTQDSE